MINVRLVDREWDPVLLGNVVLLGDNVGPEDCSVLDLVVNLHMAQLVMESKEPLSNLQKVDAKMLNSTIPPGASTLNIARTKVGSLLYG